MVLVLIFNCKEVYICLVVFIVFWKGVGDWEWAGLEGLCVCVFIKVLQRNYMFFSFFFLGFSLKKSLQNCLVSVFLTCDNSFFIIDLLSCNIETQRRILKFDSWKEREYKEKKEFEIRLKVTKRCVTLYTCSKELTRASLLSCFHHDTFPNDK